MVVKIIILLTYFKKKKRTKRPENSVSYRNSKMNKCYNFGVLLKLEAVKTVKILSTETLRKGKTLRK